MAQESSSDKELNEEDINDIEDVVSGLEMLEIHGLDQTGVKNIHDVRQKLRKLLVSKQSKSDVHGGSGEPYGRINSDKIRDLIVAQREGCQKLLSVVQKIDDFVAQLPEGNIKDDLFTAIPDTKERLERAKDSLGTDEFSILVAGDTGSGKSSLLNLLLDESQSNILPVAHTSSTSAICEIRYKSEVALEVKASGSTEFTNIPIRNNDKEHALEEISEHSHQRKKRDEKLKYETVRIYWPVEWLQNNIMIVDSPGIAESPALTELVKKYIPKASGFIYVINPTIDGGLSPDKLQDLLFTHLKKEKRKNEDLEKEKRKNEDLEKEKRKNEDYNFDPRSAIFVCNKWDDIKKNEKEEMIKHIKKNLHDIWPGFGEDQLFFFSTKQAVASLKGDFFPEDYKRLLLGLERFLPIACQNRLTKQYWIIREIIHRANFTLRLDLVKQNTDETREGNNYLKIMDDLDRILRNQGNITSDLHDLATQEMDKSLKKLKEYLFLTISDKLLQWEEGECPKEPRTPDVLDYELEHAANLRIKKCIQEWMLSNNIFGEIENKLNDSFHSQFCELQVELDFIENCKLVPGNRKVEFVPGYVNFNSVYGLLESPKNIAYLREGLIGSQMSFLANLVFAISTLMGFVKGNTAQDKVRAYNKNKPGTMKEITRTLLSKLLEENELKELFADSISEMHKSINTLLSNLPNVIQANRILAKERLQTMSTATTALYKDKHGTGFDLENDINTIYLNHIKKYDIELEELEPENWKEIGKGHYAVVYAANHKGRKVAVKKPNCPACGHTSTNYILEENNFRKLDMPNIVKFYGTAVLRKENCVYPLLVLEYCKYSLDKIVLEPDNYTAPGVIEDQIEREHGEAYKSAAGYGMNISSGLKALHILGYVHRDLKLENILVDAEGRIKLADLALCKFEADITGSHGGTPIYMAPEIQEAKIYNHSADIFSFGMVIWELWYGMRVGKKYHVTNLDEFKDNCFTEEYAPPDQWMELILNCLQREPDARPTADKVFGFFDGNSKPDYPSNSGNEPRTDSETT